MFANWSHPTNPVTWPGPDARDVQTLDQLKQPSHTVLLADTALWYPGLGGSGTEPEEYNHVETGTFIGVNRAHCDGSAANRGDDMVTPQVELGVFVVKYFF